MKGLDLENRKRSACTADPDSAKPGFVSQMAALGAARFTSPSAGPAAARIDHLNRQVSELVSRNKDLDARNTSITRELADSNARTQQALEEQAAKFAVERADLHDFVLYVQGAGRIAALQTEDQLYATRIEVLKGQDLVRKEKIRTSERDTRGLQRDWDLLLLTQENSRLTVSQLYHLCMLRSH